jgi:hypothetical protein
MNTFFTYEITFQTNKFGYIHSKYPILHNPIRKIDKLSWVFFQFNYLSVQQINLINKLKFNKTNKSLNSLFGFDFDENFYFQFEPDFSSEKNSSILNFLKKYQIQHFYQFIENPNDDKKNIIPKFQKLLVLEELLPENFDFSEYSSFLQTLFGESITSSKASFTPPFNNDVIPIEFTVLRFFNYFFQLFLKLPSIFRLFAALRFDSSLFPFFIQSLTLPFTPSFVSDLRENEIIGDAFINFIAVLDTCFSLPNISLELLKKLEKLIRSKHFFNMAIESYDIKNHIIGIQDQEKNPADVFESIIGFLFRKQGYEAALNFWKSSLYNIPDTSLHGYASSFVF